MSSIIKNISTSEPELSGKPGIAALRVFVILVWVYCIICIVTGVLVVITCIFSSYDYDTLAIYLQSIVAAIMYALIAKQVHAILRDMSTNRRPFFARQVKRVQTIALLLLAVMIAGWAFSFIAGIFGGETIPAVSVAFYAPSFPTEELWRSIFDTAYSPSAPRSYIVFDVPTIISAGLLWAISQVFKFAAWLEEEQELTL